jgi:predicted enzyme related to lactoylglutathione lyase
MANSVAHFEIFADDVERARRFYERVFGWRFEIAGPPDFYLLSTGPASDPGLTHGLLAKRRSSLATGALNSFRCTISVRSITESMAAIEAAGGTIRGAMAEVPGVGKVAEFTDTEGNIACVMQYVQGHSLAVG